MDEQNWKDMESKYYMHAANRYPMVIEKGEGTKLWDTNGNEYLDFTSGWAVNLCLTSRRSVPVRTSGIKQKPNLSRSLLA